MPVEYSVDREARLVWARPEGKLTTRETLDYFLQLAATPDLPKDTIEIVDFSGVTDFVSSYTGAQQISQSYSSVGLGGRIVATIFVGGTDLGSDIACMIQGLHEQQRPLHPLRVTRSMDNIDAIVAELRPNPRVQSDADVESAGGVETTE